MSRTKQMPTPNVPEGMVDLLKGLARNVLREKPDNIYEYAAEYFEKLLRERDGSLDKGYEKFREYDRRMVELRRVKQSDGGFEVSSSDPKLKKSVLVDKHHVPPVDMGVNGVAMQVNSRENKLKRHPSNRKKRLEHSKSSDSSDREEIEEETEEVNMNSSMIDGPIEEKGAESEEISENSIAPPKRIRKLSSKKPSQSLIAIKEEFPCEEEENKVARCASQKRSLSQEQAAFIIQNAIRGYVTKKKLSTVGAETPTNEDFTENASLSEVTTVIENTGSQTPLADNRDDLSSGITSEQEFLIDEANSMDAAFTEGNLVDQSMPLDEKHETQRVSELMKMDRLKTPESDSGLSEKSFNMKIQEAGHESCVEQENIYVQSMIDSNENERNQLRIPFENTSIPSPGDEKLEIIDDNEDEINSMKLDGTQVLNEVNSAENESVELNENLADAENQRENGNEGDSIDEAQTGDNDDRLVCDERETVDASVCDPENTEERQAEPTTDNTVNEEKIDSNLMENRLVENSNIDSNEIGNNTEHSISEEENKDETDSVAGEKVEIVNVVSSPNEEDDNVVSDDPLVSVDHSEENKASANEVGGIEKIPNSGVPLAFNDTTEKTITSENDLGSEVVILADTMQSSTEKNKLASSNAVNEVESHASRIASAVAIENKSDMTEQDESSTDDKPSVEAAELSSASGTRMTSSASENALNDSHDSHEAAKDNDNKDKQENLDDSETNNIVSVQETVIALDNSDGVELIDNSNHDAQPSEEFMVKNVTQMHSENELPDNNNDSNDNTSNDQVALEDITSRVEEQIMQSPDHQARASVDNSVIDSKLTEDQVDGSTNDSIVSDSQDTTIPIQNPNKEFVSENRAVNNADESMGIEQAEKDSVDHVVNDDELIGGQGAQNEVYAGADDKKLNDISNDADDKNGADPSQEDIFGVNDIDHTNLETLEIHQTAESQENIEENKTENAINGNDEVENGNQVKIPDEFEDSKSNADIESGTTEGNSIAENGNADYQTNASAEELVENVVIPDQIPDNHTENDMVNASDVDQSEKHSFIKTKDFVNNDSLKAEEIHDEKQSIDNKVEVANLDTELNEASESTEILGDESTQRSPEQTNNEPILFDNTNEVDGPNRTIEPTVEATAGEDGEGIEVVEADIVAKKVSYLGHDTNDGDKTYDADEQEIALDTLESEKIENVVDVQAADSSTSDIDINSTIEEGEMVEKPIDCIESTRKKSGGSEIKEDESYNEDNIDEQLPKEVESENSSELSPRKLSADLPEALIQSTYDDDYENAETVVLEDEVASIQTGDTDNEYSKTDTELNENDNLLPTVELMEEEPANGASEESISDVQIENSVDTKLTKSASNSVDAIADDQIIARTLEPDGNVENNISFDSVDNDQNMSGIQKEGEKSNENIEFKNESDVVASVEEILNAEFTVDYNEKDENSDIDTMIQPDSLDILDDQTIDRTMTTDSLTDIKHELLYDQEKFFDSLVDLKGIDSLKTEAIEDDEQNNEINETQAALSDLKTEFIGSEEPELLAPNEEFKNNSSASSSSKLVLPADPLDDPPIAVELDVEVLGDVVDSNYTNPNTKPKLELLTIDEPLKTTDHLIYSIQEVDTPLTPLTPRPSQISSARLEKIINTNASQEITPFDQSVEPEVTEEALENIEAEEIFDAPEDKFEIESEQINSIVNENDVETRDDSTDIKKSTGDAQLMKPIVKFSSKDGMSLSIDIPSSDLSDSETESNEPKFIESGVDETSRDERDEISEIENFDLSSCGEDSLEAMYYVLRKNEILLDKQQKLEHEPIPNENRPIFPEKSTEDLNAVVRVVSGKNPLKSSESMESSSNDDVVLKNISVDNESLDAFSGREAETQLFGKSSDVGQDSNEEEFFNPIIASMQQNENLVHRMHAKALSMNDAIGFAERGGDSGEYDAFTELPIDDMQLGNLERNILASSTSEADSDYFDKGEKSKKIMRDDFNISTALDRVPGSTDSESTIESAATKIQASVNGFPIRKRNRRSTSVSGEKHSSIGNAAIDKSLDELVRQHEQYDVDDTFDEDMDEIESDNVLGITEVKVEQRKMNVMTDISEAEAGEEQYENIIVIQNSEEHRTDSMDVVIRDQFLLTTPQIDESLTAQRRMTLQRGDALQRYSTPEETISRENSSKGENEDELEKTANVDDEPDMESSAVVATETPTEDAMTTNVPIAPVKEPQPKASRSTPRIRSLGPRQRSMPVQIEAQFMRVIPKHSRKRVKSASSDARDRKESTSKFH